MANRVLGIEIGENLTRVVEIDYKAKNPKIYNMFGFPTPPGMINDGVVQPDGMFRSILYSKLKEKNDCNECIGLFSGGFEPVQAGTSDYRED